MLLKPRDTYKPFEYPWAYEGYLKQTKVHWIPDEVNFQQDVNDWKSLDPESKELITQIFRFFTQSDVSVADGYRKYMQVLKPPEVTMMLFTFGAMEAVHIDAYSKLIDTVGMPETEYQAFLEYEEMVDKYEYVQKFNTKTKSGIAKSLAVYSAFTEGLQLFASFAILLNFSRQGIMQGMGQIVTWSLRDETIHVEYMIKLFHQFIDEHPRVWTKKLKKELVDICREMVTLEEGFIDLCFANGHVPGLTPDEVKEYVRYIADRRLIQLGLKGIYNVKDNPLPWLTMMTSSPEHANFFERRATEYSKGAITGSWDDVWGR